jgi:acyl-CoA synthetase (AMP-forming)/AMP-acid ligase II
MPHSLWGEVPHAFVVLRAGSAATAGAIEEFCRAHLAKFKVPARIDLVDELPRTPTGKVLKRTLREHQQQATK